MNLCRLWEPHWELPTTKEGLCPKTSPRAQPSNWGQLHHSARSCAGSCECWGSIRRGTSHAPSLLVLSSLLLQKAVQRLHNSYFSAFFLCISTSSVIALLSSSMCMLSILSGLTGLYICQTILFNVGKINFPYANLTFLWQEWRLHFFIIFSTFIFFTYKLARGCKGKTCCQILQLQEGELKMKPNS